MIGGPEMSALVSKTQGQVQQKISGRGVNGYGGTIYTISLHVNQETYFGRAMGKDFSIGTGDTVLIFSSPLFDVLRRSNTPKTMLAYFNKTRRDGRGLESLRIITFVQAVLFSVCLGAIYIREMTGTLPLLLPIMIGASLFFMARLVTLMCVYALILRSRMLSP